MKKYQTKIVACVAVAIVLIFAFWYGGNAPGLRGWIPKPKENVNVVQNDTSVFSDQQLLIEEQPSGSASDEAGDAEENGEEAKEIPMKKAGEEATEENKPRHTDDTPMSSLEKETLAERMAAESNVPQVRDGNKAYSVENGMLIDETTGKDKYLTDPVPVGMPIPIEPQDAVITDRELTCTLSVRCDTILDNIAWLDKEKVEIVPKDGIIFAEKAVTFFEGESVFHLLLREMKRNKIHMEFKNTPIYNSAYIEGIANLYEFDCGELSGWMYRVNGWFPNYGCSRYQLHAGDKVEWVYTCDLGIDVGGYYAARGK